MCIRDSTQVVYDVDDDGVLEIIVGGGWLDSKIYCLRPDGSLKWYYTAPRDPVWPYGYTYGIATSDIDNDGQTEIVLAEQYWIICLRGNGTEKWRYRFNAFIESVTLFDVDGDGKLEILSSSWSLHWFFCLDHDGSFKWYYETGSTVWAIHIGVSDIDKDGLIEYCAGSDDGYFYCLYAIDGALAWRYYTGNEIECGGVLADLDGDGYFEVCFGCSDNYVYILEHNGLLKTRYQLTGWPAWCGCLSLADIDGDKKLEIIAGDTDYYVNCLEETS